MADIFDRYLQQTLSSEKKEGFHNQLRVYDPDLAKDYRSVVFPVVNICYQALGNNSIKSLMRSDLLKKYFMDAHPLIEATFDRAFSAFACIHDPSEINSQSKNYMLKALYQGLSKR